MAGEVFKVAKNRCKLSANSGLNFQWFVGPLVCKAMDLFTLFFWPEAYIHGLHDMYVHTYNKNMYHYSFHFIFSGGLDFFAHPRSSIQLGLTDSKLTNHCKGKKQGCGSGSIQFGSGSTADLFVIKLNKNVLKSEVFKFIFLPLDPDSESGPGFTTLEKKKKAVTNFFCHGLANSVKACVEVLC
jgi:hypothetical protein